MRLKYHTADSETHGTNFDCWAGCVKQERLCVSSHDREVGSGFVVDD